ncbi:hypothetical protein C3Y87_17405 [Carbonactinospora thermoautotrophica]|uniref:hypothetical protein n=1 Tax=Carbonactinospora thermoautotrophica TaxID=1469144 RepID=UPI00227090B6|nr:hypothetical protein [Carbonactinospora thermoautotrophica]MCX9193152.1 hypothetical protein [Carbonactinospora thermoautotrophica]
MRRTSFEELVERLRTVPRDRFPAACVELLSEPIDWAALARDRLASIPDGEFLMMTRRIFVEGVEPKVFLLHDEPGRFRIVLNHFDRSSFDRHWSAGRITPHYHHFDFSTRLIRGHYHHWLFENSGTLDRPELATWHRTRDLVGHVYFLPWDEFHCVLAPEHDTVSLQIRGPARSRPRRPELTVSDAELLAARDAAVKALLDVPPAESGVVPEFAHRWLAGATVG